MRSLNIAKFLIITSVSLFSLPTLAAPAAASSSGAPITVINQCKGFAGHGVNVTLQGHIDDQITPPCTGYSKNKSLGKKGAQHTFTGIQSNCTYYLTGLLTIPELKPGDTLTIVGKACALGSCSCYPGNISN